MTKIKHNGEFLDTGTKNPEPQPVGALRIGNVVVHPGKTVNVLDWAAAARSHAVKQWLKLGIIEIVDEYDADDAPADEDDPETVEKKELIAKLEAHGIRKTLRTSLDNLRKALGEVEPSAPVVKLPGLS
jgi:hypothetical protein